MMLAYMKDLPVFPEMEEDTATEALILFYKELGWDNQQELDPKKVVINNNDWMNICKKYNQVSSSGGYFFMNYGPSVSEDIPLGKVKLYKGWTKEPNL